MVSIALLLSDKARSPERQTVCSSANIAEEVEERSGRKKGEKKKVEERRRRKKRLQSKKKGNAQPTTSAVHEVDEVDEEGFAYGVIPLHDPAVSIGDEWRVKSTQEAMQEGVEMHQGNM